MFEAYEQGRIDDIVAMCADDVTIFLPGPDIIPYAGHYCGRDAVSEYFDMIPKLFDIIDYEVHGMVAQGSKVVVNGHEVGVVKSTGKRFDNHWVMVCTIHDGVITDIFEYHDTAAVAEAFTP
jgi:ketosteroid isomerase-like protein